MADNTSRESTRQRSWLLPTEMAAHLSTPMKVNVGFALALLILGIVAIAAKIATDRLNDSLEWHARANGVLSYAAEVEANLLKAESAHRGYVLTGGSAFLQEFDSAGMQLRRSVGLLRSATRDAPAQQERVRALAAAVDERLGYLSRTNDVRRAGDVEAARAAITSGVRSELRTRTRQLLREIASAEEALLSARASEIDRTLAWSRRINLGGVLVSTLLVLFAVYVINADLRVRRRAQQELYESEQGLQDFLDSAGDLIQSTTPEGEIQYVNAAWLETLGYAGEEVIGRHALDFVAPEHMAQARALFASIFAGRVVDLDLALMTRTGQRVYVRGGANARMVNGEPVAIRAILRDVTEQREIERMKDEFISLVSHELRTPLTSIRGALGLLSGGLFGDIPARGKRMVEVATQNTDRLVRLINDVLDVERINSGKAPMVKRRVRLAEIVQQTEDVVRPLAERASIRMEVSVTDGELDADPDRLIQMLTNLISNAIKFSPPHTAVRVAAARRGDEVHITVRDNGRGIPRDKLELIFERFQQVDASDAREKGGTGLGLAISRSIVEQHDGRIWAESQPGAGATFHVILPVAERESTDTRISRAGGGPLVLICDDDRATRDVLEELLAAQGYSVIACATGEQAVATARTHRPAVILLDLLMPGMDGWRVMAQLKADAATRAIPVVIVSGATDMESEIAVPKPVDASVLLREVERALSHWSAGDCVLIVEDDPDLAQVLVGFFEQHGLRTILARDGQEAIRISQKVRPALLLLDLMLPSTDGFTVVDWLRRHDRLKDLPIIVYTARDLDSADRARLGVAPERLFTKARMPPDQLARRVAAYVGHIAADNRTDHDE